MAKLLFIFGTRPEAIKLVPLIQLLKSNAKFEVKILVTAQHRHMLDQVLRVFDIKPDFDLNLMKDNQDLTDITIRILAGCREVFSTYTPDLVILHGDTTTTLAASLAAYYQKIDVAHVEAGLRTFNIYSPFPEEINRIVTSKIAKFHFAPTEMSGQNLMNEGIAKEKIIVTGNTVIDALLSALDMINSDAHLQVNIVSKIIDTIPHFGARKFVLITGHRRENFGSGMESICSAINELADRFIDLDFVFPVHLNPKVQNTVKAILSNKKNIFLIEPLDYLPFAYLMSKCLFIITDSGGIQEEAPSLNKPVLVTRETSERPEAIAAGVVKLVGTNKEKIVAVATELLTNKDFFTEMSCGLNPYGDGKASQRIADFLDSKY